jgi:hypothetical protein
MFGSQNDAGGNEGGEGTVQVPQWMSSLPDAHKTNERFAQFKEPTAFWDKADSLLKAEGNSVVIPGKDAKPEEVAEFYKKLGRPETKDGYEINKPDNLPEGVPFDPEAVKAFKEYAHAEGFTKPQAEKLFNWYYNLAKNGYDVDSKNKQEAEIKALEETVKTQKAAVAALKDEWKDKFDGNIAKAVIGFRSFAKDMPEAEKLLNVMVKDEKFGEIRLGDHPVFNRLFYSIATSTLPDSALSGKGDGVGGIEDKNKSIAAEMFPSMIKK